VNLGDQTTRCLTRANAFKRDCVPYLFRYAQRMEHAPESMRSGAQPSSQTHHLIAEILPDIRPWEMQTIYFQAIEDGPESLLAPIEAEFARRGLSPYATYSTDLI
jgi:hypothetical protein